MSNFVSETEKETGSADCSNLAQYFDYEAFFEKADDGRELFMYDYTMGTDNHVLRRI